MELDITGKVGIENALELLEEQLRIYLQERKEVEAGGAEYGQYGRGMIDGLAIGIDVIKLNITNK